MTDYCGNRSPITGECILGCLGFGGCKRGLETPAPPWPEERPAVMIVGTDHAQTSIAASALRLEGFPVVIANEVGHPIGPLHDEVPEAFEVSGTLTATWGEGDIDPLGAVQSWIDEANSNGGNPNEIIMSPRVWLVLVRPFMTKRRWRRLRGKVKAMRRGA